MTMKYAAHIIMAVKYETVRQEDYPIYENIVLIDADSDEQAIEKAESLGRQEEEESEAFRWDDKPARWRFAGVRKLIECRTPGSLDDGIGHGTEITYSQMVLRSEEDLQQFVAGKSVTVCYEE